MFLDKKNTWVFHVYPYVNHRTEWTMFIHVYCIKKHIKIPNPSIKIWDVSYVSIYEHPL